MMTTAEQCMARQATLQRNELLVVLTKLYLAKKNADKRILSINLPTGMVIYHYDAEDASMFQHVPEGPIWPEVPSAKLCALRLAALQPDKDFVPVEEIARWRDDHQRAANSCLEMTANEHSSLRFFTDKVVDDFVTPRAYPRKRIQDTDETTT